ncbi:ABC transporter substrate-binding protein [uncultured Pseudodesulfovibrio sp.]|uniref:ABC transporter substrate-binding protein n=1 Tax=uncultured Pseudodesulfovibrio sp. TaxID=2035858 RepID=UPI0029C82B93|nr:ABC transporter substrate-binding protein [uncultured Pseudodesulfovibrio sp.]
MKRILIAIILGWTSLVLPPQASAVELTFWTTEIHEDRIRTIEFLIRAFTVMQDDVTVKLVSVNENDLCKRVSEAEKDGMAPHLIGAGSQLLVALNETGTLGKDTASRIIHSIGPERFYPGALKRLSAPGGGWYGVPFHGWVQGIWYRADWFREAGLKPPCDWASILAAAKHFHAPASGRYGILVGTDEDHYATQVFTQLACSNNAAMFDGDGQVLFDSKAMVETLEMYATLAQCGPKGPQTWRARDYFLQGRLAMLFYSTFIMDDLALANVAQDSLTGNNFKELNGAAFDPDLVSKVDMEATLYHTGKAGYGVINGFGVAAGLSGEEQAAAERFLAFLYDPAHYVSWLHMAPGGMLPVLRDVAVSDRFLTDPSGIFRRYGRVKIKNIIDGLSSMESFCLIDGKVIPAASVVYADDIIPQMIQRTVFEGVPPEKAVAQAARQIRAIVQKVASPENAASKKGTFPKKPTS